MLGADRVVATRMVVADGRYTGEIEFYAYGREQGRGDPRAGRASAGYDLADCYAYSDSVTDLPMLEAVGPPRPPSTPTGRCAGRRSPAEWPVLDFTQPVRLRTRVAEQVQRVPAPAPPGHGGGPRRQRRHRRTDLVRRPPPRPDGVTPPPLRRARCPGASRRTATVSREELGTAPAEPSDEPEPNDAGPDDAEPDDEPEPADEPQDDVEDTGRRRRSRRHRRRRRSGRRRVGPRRPGAPRTRAHRRDRTRIRQDPTPVPVPWPRASPVRSGPAPLPVPDSSWRWRPGC